VFRNSALGKRGAGQQTFSPQELLVVAVACEIEEKFGVTRKRMALIGEALRLTLMGPRSANRNARLLVTFAPPAVSYLESSTPVAEGLVLPLGPRFARVDEYLGVAGERRDYQQAALPLRPIATPRRAAGPRSR
jgi:hypothetical protein